MVYNQNFSWAWSTNTSSTNSFDLPSFDFWSNLKNKEKEKKKKEEEAAALAAAKASGIREDLNIWPVTSPVNLPKVHFTLVQNKTPDEKISDAISWAESKITSGKYSPEQIDSITKTISDLKAKQTPPVVTPTPELVWKVTMNETKAPTVNEGALNVNSSYTNTNYDELNKTGQNYQNVINDRAKKLSDITYDAAWKQTDIEVAASKEKTARSDATRAELLDVTWDFKDKQDQRYTDVADITKRQENIANRQANISAAKAGQYGDIYSDGGLANIKNDIIATYGANILNAEQYALNTNRTIDNDLLNVGLTEIQDKDKRDAFKDVLLDKNNSYMLNAIAVAAEGDKQAINDISQFYQTYIKQKADNEATRAWFTEGRAGFEEEFKSVDAVGKATILKDNSATLPGYSVIADRLPELINKYPNLSLSELEAKVAKISELALTAKQQLPTIIAKPEADRTEIEKDLLLTYGTRGLEEQQASDRSTAETIAQQNATAAWVVKEGDTISDASPEGQKVLAQNEADTKASNEAKKLRIAQLKAEQEKAATVKLWQERLATIKDNTKKREDAYVKLNQLAIEQWFQDDTIKIARMKQLINQKLPITF